MRKILALAIVLLLLVLSVAPVSAQVDPQVAMQGSGSWLLEPEDVDAKVALHIDTATGIVKMRASIPGGLTRDGQFITGAYWVAEVIDWTVVDDTVTVHIEGEAFWLPSRELATDQPGEVWLKGVLTGPGNRGEISFFVVEPVPGADPLFTIPGTIIIR